MRVGIDIGGTKIEIAGILPSGDIPFRERVKTPAGDYDATIRTIRDLVSAHVPDMDAPIGIGIPGSLSPDTGLVRNANSTCLNGRRLDRDLQAALGRQVRLENDANCFALAEATDGAGAGYRCVLGLILGTGVGSGIVVDGRLLTGANRIAGEWGHTPLPRPTVEEQPGPACFCGRHGCVETWCSGPAISADHLRHTGEQATAQDIARREDAAAASTMTRHADRLGRALASVVNILDPDVIVLGGGLSNIAALPDRLAETMRPHIFSDCWDTAIRVNQLGDSAGVIGAARLWPEQGTKDR